MKRIYFLCYMLLAAGYLSTAQEKLIQDPNAEKRTASGFHTIRVEDGVDLYLTQANEEAVAVSASKTEYRDKIMVSVEDGVLRIYFDQSPVSWTWKNRQLRAYVSVKSLKALRASGGSDVFVPTGLKVTGDFSMTISGGSDFVGVMDAENLEIKASGGSDTKVSGKVVNLKINASGGSDFHGYDLVAENVYVHASGGSDARVNATRELGVDASGGSDVDYKGNAVLKYKSSSGGSSVVKRN